MAPPVALAALWLWSIAATAMSIAVFAGNLASRDFTAFYRSAESWRATGDLYDPAAIANVNMNPPHVSVLLFAPLLLWNLPAAAAVWFVVQAAAGAAALLVIQRELALPRRRMIWILPLFLASCAVQHHWREGQVTGFLLLAATLAWRAMRHGRGVAPAWSAAAITLKPWLACWLPAMPARAWMRTMAIGVAAILIALLVQGIATWTEWVEVVRTKPVRPMVVNLSLLAAISRATGETLLNAAGGWPYGQPLWLVLVVAVIATTWPARRGEVDRSWLAFGLAGILISPLGWAYYLVAVTGPLLAWGEARRWPPSALLGVVLLMATRESMQWLAVGPTAWIGSSLAFLGVLMIWATVVYDSFSPVRIR